MRLTRQSEIAIGVLLACAAENDVTLTQRAAYAAGTSKDFAAHVVALLVKGGFLVSHRGRCGGLRLARPAQDIRLGEVLRLTQADLDPQKPGASDLDLPTVSAGNAFARLLRAATDSFLAILNDFTLADLARSGEHDRFDCLDCSLWSARRPLPSHRNPLPASQHPGAAVARAS